jgi:hypothetical protein
MDSSIGASVEGAEQRPGALDPVQLAAGVKTGREQ